MSSGIQAYLSLRGLGIVWGVLLFGDPSVLAVHSFLSRVDCRYLIAIAGWCSVAAQ